MQPVVDLVAVAYEAPEETRRMLDSLVHIEVPYTLTIVENNSPDPRVRTLLREWVMDQPQQVRFTKAPHRVYLSSENMGYARAINLGVRFGGSAPYLAALNCDIQFEPSAVRQVIEHFDAHPDVAVISPRTTDSAGRMTHAGILVDPASGRDLHRGWLQPDGPQFHDVLDVPTVSGATYFMRRSVWDEMTVCPLYQEVAPGARGGLLPTQLYYEETFHSYHVRAHGHRVVYLGTAKMIHDWDRSNPTGSKAAIFAESEKMFRTACAHHGIELEW